MIIRNLNEVKKQLVAAGEKTWIQVLISPDEAPHFAMRKFTIEPGGFMPYHTNRVEHEQLVVAGEAEVVCEGRTIHVKKGDVTFIPAGEAHSYRCVGNESFEFLCLVPNIEDTIEMVENSEKL